MAITCWWGLARVESSMYRKTWNFPCFPDISEPDKTLEISLWVPLFSPDTPSTQQGKLPIRLGPLSPRPAVPHLFLKLRVSPLCRPTDLFQQTSPILLWEQGPPLPSCHYKACVLSPRWLPLRRVQPPLGPRVLCCILAVLGCELMGWIHYTELHFVLFRVEDSSFSSGVNRSWLERSSWVEF